jgi:hypothetical protein
MEKKYMDEAQIGTFIYTLFNKLFKTLPVILLILLFSGFLNAQDMRLQYDSMNISDLAYHDENITAPEIAPDTVKKADTTQALNLNDLSNISLAFKPKLLPDHMSFMEKFLWDDNGLMRKIGIAGPLNADTRQNELQARRTMLSIHQITGLTTLGLMITADYFGQKVLDGRRDLSGTHKTFVSLTIGSYAITGLLAILSPPPMIRRDDEVSTTSIHKTLAWVHFVGMIITPILGSLVVNHRMINIDKGHYHQISAYITTAVFAASAIILTF